MSVGSYFLYGRPRRADPPILFQNYIVMSWRM